MANGQMANHVVISEVYGGGGNNGATFKNDFIELYNPTDAPVSLNGWSVQYASATGTTWNNKVNLPDVTIPAKGFYLIKGAAGTGTTMPDLPAFDLETNINLAGSNGKVALVSSTTELTGANPTSTTIIDLVGYGTVNGYEGTGAAPAASNSTSVERKANSTSTTTSMAAGGDDAKKGNGFDSNNNNADFIVSSTPTPQHLGSGTEPAIIRVVISEVYGGGGNVGAPYKSDFVELYNPTNQAIDLTGWSIQEADATGSNWAKTNLPAKSIPAKGYFLFRGATGDGEADLPTADDSHNGLSISALGGKVVLVKNNTLVTGNNPTGDHIVDKIGWGTANDFETAAGPATSISTSIERKATNTSTRASMAAGGTDYERGNGFDSNDNSFDFVISSVPNPQNMSSSIEEPAALVPVVVPTLNTAVVEDVNAKTATLGGDVTLNGGAKVTERGVVYVASATAVEPTIGTAGHIQDANSSAGEGAFTEVISGLTPNTKYYVRAYAVNSAGTSYGQVEEFTTTVASANANLAGLQISSGTFNPAFDPATTSYAVAVNHYTTLVSFIPVLEDDNATITINGTAVSNGATSAPVNLAVGDNTITVVVTAEDGTTTQSYAINVNRPASDETGGIANHVVISEVSGGGANTPSPYKEDYIELYNPTSADVVLDDWSLQFSTQTGTTWTKLPLSGTIKPKSYFLLVGATGNGGASVPYADIINTSLSTAALRGKVVLVSNNETVTGANPTGAHIVDKVGWGNDGANRATGYEGAPAPVATTTGAVERKATASSTVETMAAGGADARKGNGFDSDVNSFDFMIATTQNPQYSGSATEGLEIPTVVSATATAVASNSATLGGNVTEAGASDVTERGVVYMASSSAAVPFIGTTGAVKAAHDQNGAGEFSAQIAGLNSMTTYYARAYAINAAGTAYGDVFSFTTPASTNASLSGLALSSGKLSPAFDAATLSYSASVSSATTSIMITPTVADAGASVTINGQSVASGSASSEIALKSGANAIDVVVTAQDGTTTSTYTIRVNRALTDHLVISEVYGGAGNAGALYSSDYVELYNPTDQDIVMENWSIQYAGSTSSSWAVHTISGTVKAKGYFLVKELGSSGASAIPTPDASGSLNISGFRGKILLANNNTAVTGANPTDAQIVDLLGWGEANAAGTVGAANGYETFRAPNTNELTALERKANNYSTAATMAAGGADELKGNGFDSNDNSFDFVLSTPNPQNSSSATEEMSSEMMAPVAPTVTTATASNITGVGATLGGDVTANGGAKVTERGVVYVASETAVEPTIGTDGHVKDSFTTGGSGVFSETISGLAFNTKYYVRAYAMNEVGTSYGAVQEFTTAAASTNADLANLTISAGTLTPDFDAATLSYTATVPFSTTSLTVTPTLADANAQVTVNGSPLTGATGSADVPLVVGDNTITIVVTAQDGATTKTYTVAVNRAAASTNAALSGLALSAGTLTPAFDAATMNYTASVANSVTSMTVTPTVADETATVTVNGTAVASGSASGNIDLAVGENTITTVVTAQDGTTVNTYTVVVNRASLTSISGNFGTPAVFVLTSVYPNPMATEGAVKFGLAKPSAVQLEVFSLNGVKVLSKDLGTFAAGSHDVTWFSPENSSTLAPGVYVLRLVSNSGTVSKRFVVTR
ncbi:cadherin-like beta sandwich domain-containing protein [Rufibacter roseus]|uniref:Cadherin-like beta sandwich domain-containing protein n=1 Tax=Rufibacter roseus TaxID=1567108 RepID=A0ABW2DH15_9BACT|nr:cadherin-like beta sandwich domain-containing protein [Rufibacter roseus]